MLIPINSSVKGYIQRKRGKKPMRKKHHKPKPQTKTTRPTPVTITEINEEPA